MCARTQAHMLSEGGVDESVLFFLVEKNHGSGPKHLEGGDVEKTTNDIISPLSPSLRGG